MSKILHTLYILLLLAGGIFCVPAKSWATGYEGDILVVGSDTLELLAWPIFSDSILWDKTWEWMDKCEHRYRRSNRSYIVVWKIENEQLYLDEIRGDGDYRMPIDSIFKSYYNAEGKIPASWVTEDLRATPDNDWIYYEHIGFRRHYANEILFRVRQGRVLETIPYQNSFRKGDYPPMESCIKIAQGFDGSKFPELEGKRLIATQMIIYPTADGRIDSLSVSYKIRDDREFLEVSPQQARRYTEELRRHADSLRWDALILRGVIQPLPPYNFPLYPTSQKIKSFRLPSPGSR